MPPAILDARLQIQIELALDADCACERTRAQQEARAQRLGLVGAEVDAARARTSFDVRAAAAVDLACAMASGDDERICATERLALAVGFAPAELEELRILVVRLLA